MIVLDTTVLAYASGGEHPFREPTQRLVSAIGQGTVRATTTVEVIQEYAHVRARRHGRVEAAAQAERAADQLSPLLVVPESVLRNGLRLFGATTRLGSFDALLAAAALATGADALVSADTAFGEVPGLTHVAPTAAGVDALLSG